MAWVFGVGGLLVGLFGIVLLRGAPYLPTLTKQVETALDMVELKPGQTLLELGCGDGKVLIAAAKRGWNVVGYELNPLLAFVAWVRTRRYKGRVRVVWGDFWNKKWPPAEGIFVFLLDSFMEKLDTKIVQYSRQNSKSVKLVSFAFQIPSRKPKTAKEGLFLYIYK
jgi:16S rRNA A1518/A1519 N6-dimethyltransferase RsmA/KsgA/DIM1 with predicted DNA glycosylase/AP lyase activity